MHLADLSLTNDIFTLCLWVWETLLWKAEDLCFRSAISSGWSLQSGSLWISLSCYYFSNFLFLPALLKIHDQKAQRLETCAWAVLCECLESEWLKCDQTIHSLHLRGQMDSLTALISERETSFLPQAIELKTLVLLLIDREKRIPGKSIAWGQATLEYPSEVTSYFWIWKQSLSQPCPLLKMPQNYLLLQPSPHS
jgi:hypothetical protein